MLCAALLAFAAAAGALTMGCVALAQPRGTALAAGAAGVRTFAASQKAGAHAAEIKKKVPTPAVNWREPTGGKQPDLRKMSDISVDVDLQKQRAYVKSHGKTVYTMVISSGMDGSTPTGTWTLPMGQRGEHFYNPNEKMGADYWIRIHGEYLFHTVPTTQKMGDYIASEGAKLGKPASHGCIRLSIADAKWLYNELPDNTPVHIY